MGPLISPQWVNAADRLARETLTTDADIVARVVAGDRALFEVLMRRHNPRVYRAIRSIIRDEVEVARVMAALRPLS